MNMNKILAFYGSEKHGSEIRETLYRLGANECSYECTNSANIYYIDDMIICARCCYVFESEDELNLQIYKIFEYEDFIEKYPFKIGDYVESYNGFKGDISGMSWDSAESDVEYIVSNEWTYKHILGKELNYCLDQREDCVECEADEPVIENTVEEIKNTTVPSELLTAIENAGYDVIVDENNNIYASLKIKTPVVETVTYPTTYEECLNVLDLHYHDDTLCFCDLVNGTEFDTPLSHFKFSNHINAIYRLIVCREAYYKVYGKRPDYNNTVYTIEISRDGELYKSSVTNIGGNGAIGFLVFPSEKSCDIFLASFKDDIKLLWTLC